MQTGTLTAAEFSYDTHGRIDGIARGSRVTVLQYDPQGNLQSITDPLDRSVRFTYDDAGRVTGQVLPDGRVIEYGYDAKGNLTSITPPSRPPHYFSYTGIDVVRWYTPPEPDPSLPLTERRTRYEYNLDGRLARITRPDGQVLTFDYDVGTGQLLRQGLPTGQVRYAYNPETGNLDRVTGPDAGTVNYTYDGALPLSETWAGTVAGSVSRSYDTNFRVVSQSVNGADTVHFTYDRDDLLVGAGAMTLRRDAADGLLTGTTLGRVTDTLTYDSFGDLSGHTATLDETQTLFAVRYVRDDLGRVTEKTETIGGMTDEYGYAYDPAGRLSEVRKNGVHVAHYEYDPNGNRIAGSFNERSGDLLGAGYDEQDRLRFYTTTTGGRTDYTYTANGELTAKADSSGTITYSYDVLGNLLSVALPDSTLIEYVIDGQNRRIGKKVNGVLVQGFLYKDQLEPIAELDGAGNVVKRFVYASKPHVPDYMVVNPGSWTLTPGTYRIISDHCCPN